MKGPSNSACTWKHTEQGAFYVYPHNSGNIAIIITPIYNRHIILFIKISAKVKVLSTKDVTYVCSTVPHVHLRHSLSLSVVQRIWWTNSIKSCSTIPRAQFSDSICLEFKERWAISPLYLYITIFIYHFGYKIGL